MLDLIGFNFILLVFVFTIIISRRFPSISKILYVALAIRVATLLLGHYVITLPGSTSDMVSFENQAFIWSQLSANDRLNFFGPGSHFISWIISFPYSIFGKSILMAKSLSLFFGMVSLFLSWQLARVVWNDYFAKKVLWILAIFPMTILNSTLILREVYIFFCLCLALYGVALWFKTNSLKAFILAFFGFVSGFFFHGPIIIGGFVFLFIIFFSKLNSFFVLLKSYKISPKTIFIIVLALVLIVLYLSNYIYIKKIGYFEDVSNLQKIFENLYFVNRGSASYPDWLILKSPSAILTKGIPRALYFLYSPFPWDINKLAHLIGSFDGFLYMILSYFILKNLKFILKEPTLRCFLIILISYSFVFGIGIENFGTGIRHRSKFLIMFLLLAAPFIPKVALPFKKNFKKYSH